MKVILQENVENLGHIGDIVKVAPGYARNFLLPKGLAIEATEKNAKALAHAKKHLEYKKNRVLEAAKQLGAKIESLNLVLAHNSGADDKLFGAVTNMELAEVLKAEKLIMLTNTPGVLDKNGKLLTDLSAREIDALFDDGTLSGGMLPKISSALDAAKGGVHAVHIIDGRVPHAMLLEILSDQPYGTMIRSH